MLKYCCAYPTVTEMASRTNLSAEAVSATTTDGWKYNYDDSRCVITGATDYVQGDVTIPSSITLPDGETTLPVTGISSGFRSYAKYITGLTIPASITVIDDYAFQNLVNLTSVTFQGKIIVLNESVFNGCTSLETVNLPEGLMEISSKAFYGCTRLENIKLPSTLSTIGSDAFSDCQALKSITIPGKVTLIPGGAFANCTALKKVTIENGVKEIAGIAFGACDALEELTIPASVTSISSTSGYSIFSDWGKYAANIKSVTIENPDCVLYNLDGTEEKPLTIYGYEGSTAEAYCEKYGESRHVEFKTMGEKPAPEPVNDYGEFCDADGSGTVDLTDAQMVLTYYVEDMAENNPSWYAITKNPKAPDAP